MVAVGAALALATPAPAFAHGLTGRADLPIPIWLFSWGAAVVMVVSFAALATLWTKPRLEDDRFRPLPDALGRVLTSRGMEILVRPGRRAAARRRSSSAASRAPRWLRRTSRPPSYTSSSGSGSSRSACSSATSSAPSTRGARSAACVGSAVRGATSEPLPYPERLGHWPAAVGLFAFAWLELVTPVRRPPRRRSPGRSSSTPSSPGSRWRSTASRPGPVAARRSRSTSASSRGCRCSSCAAACSGCGRS